MAASRITPGAILEALREAVTIVEPGEVLAVRIGRRLSYEEQDELSQRARGIKAEHGVAVVFVEGEEFARLQAGDAR